MRLKNLILFAILSLFLIGVVSAKHSCGQEEGYDQLIMRLSADENAHGLESQEFRPATQNTYPTEICYNWIFGGPYDGDLSIVHNCDGTNNKVVGLSDSINAHAQDPALTTYGTHVCYGDLICVLADGDCPGDSKCVVTLSSDTNAHLATCGPPSYYNNPNAYDKKICCNPEAEPPPPPGNVYWADLNGAPITEAQIDDTVLMIYENMAGSSFDFDITEDDIYFPPVSDDDPIRTIPSAETFDFNTHRAARWTITQEDFDLGDDIGEFTVNNNEEFYFTVNGERSGNLDVEQDSDSNSPPTAQIMNPEDQNRFLANEAINFEQISSDEDDDLEITWNFGDGTEETNQNCLTTTNCNTAHTYTTSGTRTITLTANEMTRDQSATDRIEIYIFETGINIFPIITAPTEGERLRDRNVNIVGSNSRIAECFDDQTACTTDPENPDGTCYEVQSIEGGNPLWCYDFPNPDDSSVDYDLYFDWEFDSGTDNEAARTGFWRSSGTSDDVVNFDWIFSEGAHIIDLMLGHNYNNPPSNCPVDDFECSDPINRLFYIMTGELYCGEDPDNPGINQWLRCEDQDCQFSSVDPNNCYDTSTGIACCPNDNQVCNTGTGICEIPSPLAFCSDITAGQDSCNNADTEFAVRELGIREPPLTRECGETWEDAGCLWTRDCFCEWRDEDDECYAVFDDWSITCGDSPGDGVCYLHSNIVQECDLGVDIMIIEWFYGWTGTDVRPDDDCPASVPDQQIPCENIKKLPFFTFLSLIISITTLTIIYSFILKKKQLRKNI